MTSNGGETQSVWDEALERQIRKVELSSITEDDKEAIEFIANKIIKGLSFDMNEYSKITGKVWDHKTMNKKKFAKGSFVYEMSPEFFSLLSSKLDEKSKIKLLPTRGEVLGPNISFVVTNPEFPDDQFGLTITWGQEGTKFKMQRLKKAKRHGSFSSKLAGL